MVREVLRHHLADRLYHWTMAAALLTCLFTAFLPILGWKFEWVTAHWIAGIVLTAAILFHIVRAVLWQDFWSMVIGPRDLRKSWWLVARVLGFGGGALLSVMPNIRRYRRASICWSRSWCWQSWRPAC